MRNYSDPHTQRDLKCAVDSRLDTPASIDQLVQQKWNEMHERIDSDTRDGLLRLGHFDLRDGHVVTGEDIFVPDPKVEDRSAKAQELSAKIGAKLKPVDGTDELVFEHVPRTKEEIVAKRQSLVRTYWYFEVYLPTIEAFRKGELQFSPGTREKMEALAEEIRRGNNPHPGDGPENEFAWGTLVGMLIGLKWIDGYEMDYWDEMTASVEVGLPSHP